MFAQVRISALNTGLTALYLVVICPCLGHISLHQDDDRRDLLCGTPASGRQSGFQYDHRRREPQRLLSAAIASLVFLVIIHKLEYFLNARIVGAQIHARAWELLLAMLVMEAALGIVGVIAAPIYYAYLKDELVSRG